MQKMLLAIIMMLSIFCFSLVNAGDQRKKRITVASVRLVTFNKYLQQAKKDAWNCDVECVEWKESLGFAIEHVKKAKSGVQYGTIAAVCGHEIPRYDEPHWFVKMCVIMQKKSCDQSAQIIQPCCERLQVLR